MIFALFLLYMKLQNKHYLRNKEKYVLNLWNSFFPDFGFQLLLCGKVLKPILRSRMHITYIKVYFLVLNYFFFALGFWCLVSFVLVLGLLFCIVFLFVSRHFGPSWKVTLAHNRRNVGPFQKTLRSFGKDTSAPKLWQLPARPLRIKEQYFNESHTIKCNF